MRRCSQKILAVSALLLFILSFLFDRSFFGKDWPSILRNTDVIRITIITTIIAAAGLLLGLFFFRSKKYKQRLIWTIPIAFIVFSLANITNVVMEHYGLGEEYNYFSAKRHLKNGKIQILQTGLILPDPDIDWEKEQEAQKITGQHFGYKSIHLGCTVTNGIAIYNDVMEDYLDKVNGNDWRIKERKMRDSIIKSGKSR